MKDRPRRLSDFVGPAFDRPLLRERRGTWILYALGHIAALLVAIWGWARWWLTGETSE